MLIPIDKALEILEKGDKVTIVTSDDRIAIVPADKSELQISSAEAVNMMMYVLRPAHPQETSEEAKTRLTNAMEEYSQRPDSPANVARRKQLYQDLRGTT